MQLNQIKPFQRVVITGHPIYDMRTGEVGLDVDRNGASFIRFESAKPYTAGAFIETEYLRRAA